MCYKLLASLTRLIRIQTTEKKYSAIVQVFLPYILVLNFTLAIVVFIKMIPQLCIRSSWIVVLLVLVLVCYPQNSACALFVPLVSAWAANAPHTQHLFSWGKAIRPLDHPSVFGRTFHQNYRGGGRDTDLAAEASKTMMASQMAQKSEVVSPENLALLSDRGRSALQNLVQYDADRHDQLHVYGNWPPQGVDDDNKRRLAEQVRSVNRICISSSKLSCNYSRSDYCFSWQI